MELAQYGSVISMGRALASNCGVYQVARAMAYTKFPSPVSAASLKDIQGRPAHPSSTLELPPYEHFLSILDFLAPDAIGLLALCSRALAKRLGLKA
jgi:hypothetical protein